MISKSISGFPTLLRVDDREENIKIDNNLESDTGKRPFNIDVMDASA